jgi:serine/threonine-protein kinase
MSDDRTRGDAAVPSSIGRYQITGSLGFGAMGAVYKAFDPLIKRTLAIKTIRLDIPRHSPQHQAFIERFYQEARISGTLSHPSIVTLFDIGEENGVPFLAMEFVDGKTIAAVLEEGVRYKPEKVIALVSQVAAALDYAHSRGVVHRDIKPSNLIVHEGDKVKVTDFGIAKLADSEITHAGALLGTPSYMSPEQAMGEKLDGRSDIFSLGVVAFEMLSGLQPFPGANVTSILYKLVHVDPVEPADLETNGLVPQKWREVFHKVLAKKPENRYATAGAFVQDLEYCLGSWFTGLGDGETVSLQVPPPDETTLTLPRAPVPEPPPPPAAPPAGAPGESETLVLPSPIEDLVPPTVLMPAASATLPPPPSAPGPEWTRPPEPTLRDVAPAAAAADAARSPRRSGTPAAVVLGGVAAALALLALAGWALWGRTGAPDVAPEPETSTAAPPAEPTAAPAPATPEAPTPKPPAARPTPPPAGTADVLSTPPGATVSVDGRPAGKTPLAGLRLRPGKRRLEIALEGHETWRGTVDVAAGEPGRVEVRLKAIPRPVAPPTPEPVDVARVYPNQPGEVDTLAKKVSGSSPSYPADRAGRLKSGERVSVVVRFVVTETGQVEDVAVVESAGRRGVDEVVVSAVRGWRFEPASRRGTRVKVEVTFKQTFLGG